MAYINPLASDAGLDFITSNAERLVLCSSEPADYASVAAAALAEKTGLVGGDFSANEDGGGGRQARVLAITDAVGIGTGTASHWVLVDDTGTRILASESLSAPVDIANESTVNIAEFAIRIVNPV